VGRPLTSGRCEEREKERESLCVGVGVFCSLETIGSNGFGQLITGKDITWCGFFLFFS